jgi:hypothetical protein
MEVTIGFITIFISIIIPGLLFRRFFYFSEFSKQFSTKETVYQSIFYSIIPGIVVQIFGAILYYLIRNPKLNIKEIYVIYGDILNANVNLKEDTIGFLNNNFGIYLIHILNIYILSVILGIFISRLIRYYKLDIITKIFRFKNQWYYIFSGEILLMKKFKSAFDIVGNISGNKNLLTSTTYADILIENSSGRRELYTGFVVDYDLNNDDISVLERIYLLNTVRYKKIKKSKNGKEIVKTKTKNIPGEIFILKGKDIINMNLTYIPSLKKELIIESLASKKQNIYNKIINSSSIFTVVILPIILFFNNDLIINFLTFNDDYKINIEGFNFWGKTLFYFIIIQLISIFLPYKTNEKLTYNIKFVFKKLILLCLLLLVFYIFFF